MEIEYLFSESIFLAVRSGEDYTMVINLSLKPSL